jgi:type I restriction enzyme, R subunit
MAQMYAIIGDPERLKEVASDFVNHYENRISQGAIVKGKAVLVCSFSSKNAKSNSTSVK